MNVGFARSSLYEDPLTDVEPIRVPVTGSIEKTVEGAFAGPFTYLCMNGENTADITREIRLETSVEAPVQQGDPVGRRVYLRNGQEIGIIRVTAAKDVLRATFSDYLWMVVQLSLIHI